MYDELILIVVCKHVHDIHIICSEPVYLIRVLYPEQTEFYLLTDTTVPILSSIPSLLLYFSGVRANFEIFSTESLKTATHTHILKISNAFNNNISAICDWHLKSLFLY